MCEPALYSYTAPKGLTGQPLRPPAASWQGGDTAILSYEEVRKSDSPKQTLLEFLQSAYEAGEDRGMGHTEVFRAG